jgi:hypothetical protein
MPSFHIITHKGVTDSISGWAKKAGIPPSVFYSRVVTLGWTMEKALTAPVQHKDKRIKRTLPRIRNADRTLVSNTIHKPVTLAVTPFEELKNQQLAIQRHFNSILRQFNRDLHTIMGRSLDRGVVADQADSPFDRSTPTAQDSV